MSDQYSVEIVPVEEIKTLRQLVLWPHLTIEGCEIDPDRLEDTYHVVVKDNDTIVCCGTFLVEAKDHFSASKQYRLRAMGTHPHYRKNGLGKMLIEFTIEHLKALNVDLIWCDARIVATGFYEKMGFSISGEQYEVPIIGPHYLMYIEI